MNLTKIIRKKISEKRGSYVTEAALFMPALIICVCALILIIRIIGCWENICFITAEKVLETDMKAYKNKYTASLCSELEKEVSENVPADFRTVKFRYLFTRGGVSDLIELKTSGTFRVTNIIGINGKIRFEEQLLTRGFTGARNDGKGLSREEFMKPGAACEVLIFPRYGIRYHSPGCVYVRNRDEDDGRVMSIQKEDARRKGYTPCNVCGGAAVV